MILLFTTYIVIQVQNVMKYTLIGNANSKEVKKYK